MSDYRTPVERMVDLACGFTPGADVPQIVRDFAAHVAATAIEHFAGFVGMGDKHAGLVTIGTQASVDFALFDLDQRIAAARKP